MPLSWDARMRLFRLGGAAEELVGFAGGDLDSELEPAFGERIGALADEVQAVVGDWDPLLAEELERVIGPDGGRADVRAAALVGWLKAALAAESLTEQRGAGTGASERSRRRQTIGFKIRSPLTREPAGADGSADA